MADERSPEPAGKEAQSGKKKDRVLIVYTVLRVRESRKLYRGSREWRAIDHSVLSFNYAR